MSHGLSIGSVIADRYRLERKLGRGAMGTVFLATHQGLGRKVAVKFLDLIDEGAEGEQRIRFEREGRAAAAVTHPNVVDVLDVGSTDTGIPFLVMEYLEGISLNKLIKRHGALPPRVAAAVMSPVLDALHAAHRSGVVHRDLKPGNVMLAAVPARTIKLLDFGVSSVGQQLRVTQAGTPLGTPLYMAPEQALDSSTATASSDLYSAGAMLFELLVGQVPIPGNSMAEIMLKVVRQPAPPLATALPGVDPRLARLVDSMLAKDPQQRPASAAQARGALLEIAVPDTEALWALATEAEPEQRSTMQAGIPALATVGGPRETTPPPLAPQEPARLGPFFLGLAAVVFAAVAAATGLWAWQSQQEVERLRAELEEVRKQATEARPLVPAVHPLSKPAPEKK